MIFCFFFLSFIWNIFRRTRSIYFVFSPDLQRISLSAGKYGKKEQMLKLKYAFVKLRCEVADVTDLFSEHVLHLGTTDQSYRMSS